MQRASFHHISGVGVRSCWRLIFFVHLRQPSGIRLIYNLPIYFECCTAQLVVLIFTVSLFGMVQYILVLTVVCVLINACGGQFDLVVCSLYVCYQVYQSVFESP